MSFKNIGGNVRQNASNQIQQHIRSIIYLDQMGQTIKIKDPFTLKSRTILWNKGQNSWLSIEMKKKTTPKTLIKCTFYCQTLKNLGTETDFLYLIKMIKRKATAILYFIVKDWVFSFRFLFLFFFFVEREQDKYLHSLFFHLILYWKFYIGKWGRKIFEKTSRLGRKK